MLDNDITDVLDLVFTSESDFFGRKQIVELVPGESGTGGYSKLTPSNPLQAQ